MAHPSSILWRSLRWLSYSLILLPIVLVAALFLAPPPMLAGLAEKAAARFADIELTLEALDVAWFDEGPGVALTSLELPDSLADADSAEAVVDAGELLSLNLVFDRIRLDGARIEVERDAAGQWNWQTLLPADSSNSATTGPEAEQAATVSLPSVRQIAIEDVVVQYDNALLERQAVLSLQASGSTTDPQRPTELQVEGNTDDLPVSLALTVNPLSELAATLQDLAVTAQAEIGQSAASLDGVIGDPTTLGDLDLVFSIEAPDLQDVEALAGLALPTLPPWRIAGEVARDGDDWLLRRFDGRVGDSDLQGDIRTDPTLSPPTVYANLISETLDLDDLAGLFGGVPDPDEVATDEQQQRAEARDEDQRLLPDEPLAIPALTEFFTGAIDYRAESVRSPVWPITSLDTRFVVDEGITDVERLIVDLAEGRVSGQARLDANQQPERGEIELEMSAVNLRTLMQTIGIDDDSFGQIGGNLRFWFSGDSLAEMASSLDGGLFMLMTQGQLDALLAELAGIDVLESLFLALDPGKTLTSIDCAYLDLQAEDGVVDVAQLVVDSADTLFIGDGEIDLDDESLDVAVEPHPKDASILSAQTSVRVRGTVGDLQVLPGTELPLRATAAAVLSTLAAPVAALLPLVQTGDTEQSAWCEGLIDSLDDAVEDE